MNRMASVLTLSVATFLLAGCNPKSAGPVADPVLGPVDQVGKNVKYVFTTNLAGVGEEVEVKVHLEYGRRARIDVPGARFAIVPGRLIEIRDEDKKYVEAFVDGFGISDGPLGIDWMMTIPPGFVSPKMLSNIEARMQKKIAPDGRVMKEVEEQTVAGPMTLRYFYGKDGNINEVTYGGENGESRWIVKSKQEFDKGDPNDFVVGIPDGYTPFADMPEAIPLQEGQSFPFDKVLNEDGKTPVKGKPFLLAVLDGDSVPSKGMMEWLGKSGLRLPLYVLFESEPAGWTVAPSLKRWTLAQGKNLEKEVASTPTLMLIDVEGKLHAMWMGYSAELGKRYSKEVADAIAEMDPIE
jgi:hypothetical protein